MFGVCKAYLCLRAVSPLESNGLREWEAPLRIQRPRDFVSDGSLVDRISLDKVIKSFEGLTYLSFGFPRVPKLEFRVDYENQQRAGQL